MSKEQRDIKRKTKRRRWMIIIILIILLFVITKIVQYRSNKVSLVKQVTYCEKYNTDVCFFKDIDYIELDDFSNSSLIVPEGSKVNGYTTLTKKPLKINKDYLELQIKTLDLIIKDEIYKNWSSIIDEIGQHFVGLAKVQSQINGNANQRKEFLVNAARYLGDSLSELKKLKSQFEKLNNNKEREISLGGLFMKSTGYVYSTVNSSEKIISERLLPYIDDDVLKRAGKIDKQDNAALKVVGNDHLFAAFTLPKNLSVKDQENVLNLKKEFMGSINSSKNVEYYDMLVKRVDRLREYPIISIHCNDNQYDAYVVDVIDSGKNNIIIVMLKNYINVFAEDNLINLEVNINEYQAYELEESAICNINEKTIIKKTETGLYKNDISVVVKDKKNGKVYLPIDQNENIEIGMSYKVYP